jgi:hypothetical protein
MRDTILVITTVSSSLRAHTILVANINLLRDRLQENKQAWTSGDLKKAEI